MAELAKGVGARGYPAVDRFARVPRAAAAAWLERRFGVTVGVDDVAACVGTKEFVASLAQYLHLRSPERDTVLYPRAQLSDLRHGCDAGGPACGAGRHEGW